MLSGAASLAGALLGALLALFGSAAIESQIPVDVGSTDLLLPARIA